jgi:hypothetical protein
MTTTERLTEEQLPVEPAVFESRLIAEIDAFIGAHDLGAPRFDEQLTEAEMREGLYTRVYNEIMAADVPRDMLDEADYFEDPQIFTHLLKQIQDEAKHARLLAGRLADLEGDPSACFERANPSPLWDDFESLSIVEQAATLQGAGERMAKARHPNELRYYDDETAKIYENVIVPEEQFHAKIGENVLRHCVDRDSQLAALQRARAVQDILLQHNDTGGDDYGRAAAQK